MFFLTPSYIKHGRQFLKDARKLLDYKRDLVSAETNEEVERELGQLDAVLRSGDKEQVETQMHRVDEVCGKLAKPHPEAAWRENVEVFLVAIVIALAVRTYFLQPFTIPTGSMQPTLNGIIGHVTNEPAPNPIVRLFHTVWYGRSYVDVVAKEDEEVINYAEAKRFLFFTYTRIETSRGNVYWAHAPFKTVHDDFRLQRRLYKAGEPILRGYVNTGDHVFVDKFTYQFAKPARGDVFVFTTQGIPLLADRYPTSQFYIKRLAGLPGDTLRVDPPNLYLNGQRAQAEPFARVMSGTRLEPHDGYRGYSNVSEGNIRFQFLGYPDDSFAIGAKQYFALGDNSYNSADSRDWGTVPQQNIMGRGVFVYWPFSPHWGRIR